MHKETIDDTTPRLVRLEEMKKYRIAKGEPDIREWEVVTSDKRNVGHVHDLIFDLEQMKVRYLDILVEPKILGTKKASHVLIPIAGATLDDDDNRVYLEDISTSRLAALPPYDHRVITREYEATLGGFFSVPTEPEPQPVEPPSLPVTTSPAGKQGEDFYAAPRFSENRFWGLRRAGREGSAYVAPVEEEELNEPT